jgi:hypothetical protein
MGLKNATFFADLESFEIIGRNAPRKVICQKLQTNSHKI